MHDSTVLSSPRTLPRRRLGGIALRAPLRLGRRAPAKQGWAQPPPPPRPEFHLRPRLTLSCLQCGKTGHAPHRSDELFHLALIAGESGAAERLPPLAGGGDDQLVRVPA